MRVWRESDNRPDNQGVHIDETVLKDFLSFLDIATTEKKLINQKFEVHLSSYLTSDVELIKYRQHIVSNLLENSSLLLLLENLLGLCETWQNILNSNIIDWFKLLEAIKYFEEYKTITTGIISLINNIPYASEGLKEFRDYIEDNISNSNFEELGKWFSVCCKGIMTPRSMRFVFGVNEDFGVSSIGFLSIDDLYYPGVVGGYGAYTRQIMKYIQGAQMLTGGGFARVEPLQKYKKNIKEPSISGLEPLKPPRIGYDPFQMITNPIDISDSTKNIVFGEFKRAVTSVKTAIKNHTRWLLERKNDIIFYLRAVRICKYIDSLGYPACFPKCCEIEDKRFECKGMYPIDLAAKFRSDCSDDSEKRIVLNDISFDKDNCILLITGVNQGGKTTFLKTIAFIQFLFQIGIKVTCDSAELSPVDGIFTIFNREEDNRIPHGRLGQELNYIVNSFKSITPYSLVLLNEPFSSTAADSAVYLCKEMISLLLILKIRSVMVSHLYRLTYIPEMLNEMEYDTKITNMTTEKCINEKGEQAITYKIIKGIPEFDSHAEDAYKRVVERVDQK